MITERKECIAMLLAGGRGSRLKMLTEHVAKPAVTFGGKYKIIDFPLTNCVHSGIDTVGVMTQYQPLLLHDYIGKGQHWDLDLLHGGVSILPPHSKPGSTAWYSGTANAVYQNQNFIETFAPEYVLVLAADHVYKMNYGTMLEYHKQVGAACTIAVIEVPLKDASRFGILNTDPSDRVVEFEEKPEHPKNNLASMGIYIFNWRVLRGYLNDDELNPESSHDFGKDVLPAMLRDGLDLYAYRFDGYWKDVGTDESLWQANMDLLDDLHLGFEDWHILSKSSGRPPHFISPTGSIKSALITEGCEIYGTVENSILSVGVVVEEGAIVRDSVIMENAHIGKNAIVEYCILDEEAVVPDNCVAGEPRERGKLNVYSRDTKFQPVSDERRSAL
ncbi:MAG: glucose-1-phosphate adenylyltransferase [Oscillospiraceae bacterium]|nr:glucose-1-phosphate adenylyltransferase [Oscillospiraceae bacterium]MCL2278747.1 glucose-1-phosphate adenylyltransferase [Oscillospiraceae bacterium]